MPEIERVSRVELLGDRLDRITSEPLWRKLARQLPISAVEPGGFLGLKLFRRLFQVIGSLKRLAWAQAAE